MGLVVQLLLKLLLGRATSEAATAPSGALLVPAPGDATGAASE